MRKTEWMRHVAMVSGKGQMLVTWPTPPSCRTFPLSSSSSSTLFCAQLIVRERKEIRENGKNEKMDGLMWTLWEIDPASETFEVHWKWRMNGAQKTLTKYLFSHFMRNRSTWIESNWTENDIQLKGERRKTENDCSNGSQLGRMSLQFHLDSCSSLQSAD